MLTVRGLVVLAVGVVLALSACGSADSPAAPRSGPETTANPLGPAPTRTTPAAIASALLPEAPSLATAGVVEAGCDAIGMPGTIEPGPDDAVFTERQAANGSHERVFGGINPRVEVSAVPFGQPATEAESAAAQRFVTAVKDHIDTSGWTNPAKVVADGYRPLQRCNTHFINLDYVFDGRELDPSKPEFLVLSPSHGGRVGLHAAMFYAASNAGHGPQRFGSLAIWHYHEGGGCMVGGLVPVPGSPDDCPDGSEPYPRTPEMLHVSLMAENPFDPGM